MPVPGQSFSDYLGSQFDFGDGSDGNVMEQLQRAILAALAQQQQQPPPPASGQQPPGGFQDWWTKLDPYAQSKILAAPPPPPSDMPPPQQSMQSPMRPMPQPRPRQAPEVIRPNNDLPYTAPGAISGLASTRLKKR